MTTQPKVRIELAPEVVDDIDRFIDDLEQHQASDVTNRVAEISRPFRSFRAAH